MAPRSPRASRAPVPTAGASRHEGEKRERAAGGDPSGLETKRAWQLLLLDAAERAAITPLPSERLHRLAYLANCLAPVYDLPAEDGKILKYRRGPFYPDLQWDIDRVSVMGLVSRENAQVVQDAAGWWFAADYSLTATGVAATCAIMESPRQRRIHDFMMELMAAYSSLPDAERERAALADVTFADPAYKNDVMIDFGEWSSTSERNRSVATALAFDQYAPSTAVLHPRDRLHLYLQFLGRELQSFRRRRAG
jgi:hypothetical protein